MEACGQEGRGPTWAVAPTRRRRRGFIYIYIHTRIYIPIYFILCYLRKFIKNKTCVVVLVN
jgi:hypothetical protein